MGITALCAFLAMTIWKNFDLGIVGTDFVPLVFYFALGIGLSWTVCIEKLIALLDLSRVQWFFSWAGFLFTSLIAYRWRPRLSAAGIAFTYFDFFLSLVFVVAGGMVVIFGPWGQRLSKTPDADPTRETKTR